MKPLSLVTSGMLTLVFSAAAAGQDAPALQAAGALQPDAAGAPVGGAAEPGYLGIKADDSGPGDGIRVAEAIAGGPAARGGIRTGDLITTVQGQTVRSLDQFAGLLGDMPAGAKVTFVVVRADEKQSLDVVLGSRSVSRTPQLRLGPAFPAAPAVGAAPLGVRVQAVSEQAAQRLSLPAARGAQVTAVAPDSAADKAGIVVDAVIVSIGGRDVASPDDAAQIIGTVQAGEVLKFELFERGGRVERTLTVARATPPESASVGGIAPVAPGAPSGAAVDRLMKTDHPVQKLNPEIEDADARARRLEQRIKELEQQLFKLETDLRKMQQDIKDRDRAAKRPEPKFRLIPQASQ